MTLDDEGTRRMVRLIEPLRLLGSEHIASVIADYCKSRLCLVEGREHDDLLNLLA